MSKEQKFLDAKGVEVLWKQIDLNDYPNNETLIAVLNAIDETKADKNEIKQSDWNQNDESAADYIKNRTHYEEIVETGEVTEVYNGSVTNRIMLNVITYDFGFGEMLYVTFDGVKYKLYGHRSGIICSYTSNEGDIPFYVNHDMLDQVLNFTCKDSGTHMVLIEIPVIKSIVHKLDSKFIPDSVVDKEYLAQELDSSKPDWNQSNENEADYIKNRTHYEDTIETGEYETICYDESRHYDDFKGEYDNWEGLYDTASGEMPRPSQFYVDYIYITIDNDGIRHKYVRNNINLPVMWEFVPADNSDLPVKRILVDELEGGIITIDYNDTVDNHTVLIEKPIIEKTIVQLDEKFIPDSVVKKDYLTQQLDSSKADWNQNNETAVDYIKNKPFGEDIQYSVVVDEKEIECYTAKDNGYYTFIEDEYVHEDFLLNDKPIAFLWDGTMYDVEKNFTSYGDQQYIYCGNAYLLGISDQDTGLPFCVRVIIDDYIQVAGIKVYARTQGNHTIALYAKSSVVKTIDEKYLPDSVKNENIVHLQSDWNQSDENSADYIKNKPFYEETIVTGEVETLYEESYTFSAAFTLPKTIYNDVLYVTFNEENYTLTRHDINPIMWDYHSTDGTKLPFDLYYDGLESKMYFDLFGYEFTTDKVDVLIEAPVIETVVHQLDEKFISEAIARTSDIESQISVLQSNLESGDVQTLETANKYTDEAIATLVGTAPETLDTIQELATAMKENNDVVTALNDAISNKADKTDIVQGDWDQNDEAAADYIKNRTHYDAILLEEVIPETVITSSANTSNMVNSHGLYQTNGISGYNHFVTGDEYLIIIDGVEYREVAFNENTIGIYHTGNNPQYGGNDYTMPVVFAGPNYMGGGTYVCTLEANKSYTVSVYHVSSSVKQLDEKYIPDTIARASSLNALVGRVTATEGEIDTVNNKVDNHITNADIHFTTTERTKLASIDTDANKYIHPSYTERTGVPTANQTPGFGETFTVSQPVSDATGHITAINSRTITIPDAVATTNEAGLMSSDDKNKLETINIAYGICDTASNTVEKIITLIDNDYWSLKRGAIIVVSFTNTNTAISPLFNVNGTGGIQVKYNNAVITSKNRDFAGYEDRTSIYMYDGTGYVFLGWSHYEKNTDTRVQQIALPTTGSYPMLLAAELTNNTSNYTSHVHKESKLYYNAHYETLYAPNIEGNLNGSATTLSEKLPIELGGTGATTPDGAVGNLKVMPQVSYNNTQYILGMDENGIFMVDYVNGFTFSIAGITYNSNYGMTWEEWVNSSYNTGGYVISGVDTVSNAEGKGVMGENAINAVMKTDLIVENYAYTINTASSEPT